jgi:hypothetical protein
MFCILSCRGQAHTSFEELMTIELGTCGKHIPLQAGEDRFRLNGRSPKAALSLNGELGAGSTGA